MKDWIKRIYGDSISPREIFITAVVVVVFVAVLNGG